MAALPPVNIGFNLPIAVLVLVESCGTTLQPILVSVQFRYGFFLEIGIWYWNRTLIHGQHLQHRKTALRLPTTLYLVWFQIISCSRLRSGSWSLTSKFGNTFWRELYFNFKCCSNSVKTQIIKHDWNNYLLAPTQSLEASQQSLAK